MIHLSQGGVDMKWRRRFIHLTLFLLLLPALVFPVPPAPVPSHQEIIPTWGYDTILSLIDELESGELEKRCSEAELEHLISFLALLAREGVTPNDTDEELSIALDTELLLYGDADFDDLLEYAPISSSTHFSELIHQTGWVKKKWKKTKKFVKKHKKAIIIGAAVVVVTTAVVIAVVASSSAAATTVAGAGTGAGTAAAKKSKSPSEKAPCTAPPRDNFREAAPTLHAAISEETTQLKESIQGSLPAPQQPCSAPSNQTWIDTVRERASTFAHRVYDEVTELVGVIPEELDRTRDLILTDDLRNSPFIRNDPPLAQVYDSIVDKGRDAIDAMLGTDPSQRPGPLWPEEAAKLELPYPGRGGGRLPKRAGKVRTRVGTSGSQTLEKAIEKNRHVATVEKALASPVKEVKKSIKSFQKQISIHKDKGS